MPRPGVSVGGAGEDGREEMLTCSEGTPTLKLKCPCAHDDQRLGGPGRWGSTVGDAHSGSFLARGESPMWASEDEEVLASGQSKIVLSALSAGL